MFTYNAWKAEGRDEADKCWQITMQEAQHHHHHGENQVLIGTSVDNMDCCWSCCRLVNNHHILQEDQRLQEL